jgi:DNA-binding response OmpR family regulator
MKTRVLVADRDVGVRDVYRLFLEGCGFEVDTASDALQCCAVLIERTPDAVVLEHGLLWGGADGVVARMREDWDVPSVPVVLIIHDVACDEVSNLVEDPVVACLRKPFRMNVLLRHLTGAEQGIPTRSETHRCLPTR